ncbi:unnamed protein product [Arabis nemorensis]|uniref:Uncharacterized protein n=1 Tax=Arabis nemorensis TaxID=586526 RepID=A0A565CTB5_9BRAS|nr:unnamed protein product [Arabis nemorensis]
MSRAIIPEGNPYLLHEALSKSYVGDAGPILDIMAVTLESMLNITVMARTLIAAVFTGFSRGTFPSVSSSYGLC